MEVGGIVTESENGQTLVKPFIFSNIITSVDDSKLASIKEDSDRLSVVGEIMVKVYRKMHEKALKGQAMSHGTTLGVPQAVMKKKRYTSRYLDGEDYPIAIYRFKYRSKRSLQSLLILERTPELSPFPSPSPIPNGASGASGSFNLDSLDATQKAKLQEFLGNLMGTGTQSNGERKIKREREEGGSGPKASKRSRKGKRVEIDLTGDDSD
ncbi:hypothetical protein OCU04_005283 [Sclerotinia nivalis]|uniref:DUF7918 domain-containing protein n=1 Tax=Sclerotinia nivalis TaxID=352851 RepID=A0A9X0DLN3_9HELO|nr:hypothetical protein OCU04_005283 [Sclerotinia nivalis]